MKSAIKIGIRNSIFRFLMKISFLVIFLFLSYLILIISLYSYVFYNIFGPYTIEDNYANGRGDSIDISNYDADSLDYGSNYNEILMLRRYNHIFSIKIFEFSSKSFAIGAKWRGNDLLAIQIAADPGIKIARMVQRVGSIRIKYYFLKPGEPVQALDVKARDATCPPLYPSPFWQCDQRLPGLRIE